MNVCSKAGISNKSYRPKIVSLAMKTALRLSWNQHRKQKQYLSKFAAVKYESGKKERVERKRILGDHIKVKMLKVKEKDENTHDSVSGLKSCTCCTCSRFVYIC